MLGGEISLVVLCCLLKEIINQLIDSLFGDLGSNGDWVVLKDVDQTFLDEWLVDVVRLLQEELNPAGEVDLVLQEIFYDLLDQDVGQFEDLRDLGADGSVLGELLAAEDLLEGIVEREDQLNDQLGNTRLY